MSDLTFTRATHGIVVTSASATAATLGAGTWRIIGVVPVCEHLNHDGRPNGITRVVVVDDRVPTHGQRYDVATTKVSPLVTAVEC